MKCAACGHEAPEGFAFCNGCGAELEVTCATCGANPPPESRFCNVCGAALPGSGDRVHRSVRPSVSLATNNLTTNNLPPKHLADKVRASRAALEGERKQVTVLFADVKGSMELAEQMDPEEWSQIMQRFFAILSDGVERFEGFVDKFTGDGIMALFGAPIAHEDHAQRACYAALHLRDELRRYADELRVGKGLNFSVRIGINSGDVVVGRIGDDLRMEYTAQGHTVGLAQRMEALAEVGHIYLAEGTAQLAWGYVDLRDLGTSKIKGLSEPVRVYELQSADGARTRFDVSRARGLSRFVGRKDEVAAFETALQCADAGQGGVIGVVAEAGTGKSRLCFEFVEQCRAKSVAVLEGRAVAHGRTIPYLPVLQIVRQYFGIGEREHDRAAREKIAGRLLLLEESFREVLPILFEFLGVAEPDAKPVPVDSEERQRRLFAVLRKLTQSGNLVVLLIEDLHWLDESSEAWVAEWVDAMASSRNLMIVNFRPEYHAAWMQRVHYQQMSLLPLGPDATRDLVQSLIGSDPTTSELPAAIHARTAGNPFFTEEVVRSLIESRALVSENGGYRLVAPIGNLEVPATVQSVLAARIDRLAQPEKQLLQAASVIGKEFPEPILLDVVGSPRAQVAQSVAVLKEGEFVYEKALYPEVVYEFKHPLTQEVALGSQLQQRRRETHAAVARAIEARNPDDLDEQAALLAHHWDEAADALQAAHWHMRAAGWAGVLDAAEAMRHLRCVLEATTALPDSEEVRTLSLQASGEILSLGWRGGVTIAEMEAAFDAGRAAAEKAGDTNLLARLYTNYSAVLVHRDRPAEAVRVAGDALGFAERSGDLGLLQAVRVNCAWCYVLTSQLQEGLAMIETVEGDATGNPRLGFDVLQYSPSLAALCAKSNVLMALGKPREALRLAERAVELSRTSDLPETLGWAHSAATYAAWFLEEPEQANRHGAQGLEEAQGLGNPLLLQAAWQGQGTARLTSNDWDGAVHGMGESLAIVRGRSVSKFQEPWLLAFQALAKWRRGDRDALEVSTEALTVSRQPDMLFSQAPPPDLIQAQLLREIRGASARTEAQEHLGNAEQLIRKTGARLWQPFVHVEHAEWAKLDGDTETARTELEAAAELFEEMGAGGRAERARAAAAD